MKSLIVAAGLSILRPSVLPEAQTSVFVDAVILKSSKSQWLKILIKEPITN